MRTALSFRDLTVLAGHDKQLLGGVTLDFDGPGLYGVIGPNGAGKSTLIRAAIGLLHASSGEVLINDRPLRSWSGRALAAHIGYMPQQMISYWDLRVREMLQLRKCNISAELLERCQITDLLEQPFSTLSGGEQARVSVARSLIHQPQLVFADEPAAHLDMPHQHTILQLLKEYAAARTVVVVLHDLHLASRYCDHIALLSKGKVLAAGTPENILTPQNLKRSYGVDVARIAANGWSFYSVTDTPTE
jgi:ABC-type cobalamin/Fe3+-siderophores transport system ATPase subunit